MAGDDEERIEAHCRNMECCIEKLLSALKKDWCDMVISLHRLRLKTLDDSLHRRLTVHIHGHVACLYVGRIVAVVEVQPQCIAPAHARHPGAGGPRLLPVVLCASGVRRWQWSGDGNPLALEGWVKSHKPNDNIKDFALLSVCTWCEAPRRCPWRWPTPPSRTASWP
eukprot:s2050_g15.t1